MPTSHGNVIRQNNAALGEFRPISRSGPPSATGYRLEHDGSSAAQAGDTLPCEGVNALAADSDAYVQTVIRRDLVKLIPNDMIQDILDYHSGVEDAAQTAARAGAKRLVLTHMVPAPTPEQYPEWIARAAEHFDGEIIIGDDLTTVTVGQGDAHG